MKKVELFQAFEWICEECGKNNYASAVTAELTDEEKLQYAKEYGHVDMFCQKLPEGMNIDLVTYPTQVKCLHCGEEYESQMAEYIGGEV